MRAIFIIAIISFSLVFCMDSCSNHRQQEVLNRAELLMEAHPDSALTILEGIEKSELGSKEAQARYALLMSMALDKNYIDTTTFDVLQPAIDFYIERGTPTERLRTYYYQGRIYQNKGELDNALNSFIKGIDASTDSNDSLSIARTLVAQGGLYADFYDFDSYTNCHLKAAKIYNKLALRWNEFDCLLNALNGAIALGNKDIGDSILSLSLQFRDLDKTQKLALTKHKLSYALRFGDNQSLRTLITSEEDNSNLDPNGLLNLALAYNQVGETVRAKQLLDYVNNGLEYDTLKYLAILVPILKNMEDYKNAFAVYTDFSHKMDSINTFRFDQKSKSVAERHQLELKAEKEARETAKIIWSCIAGIIFLILVAAILLLLFRSNKIKKDLAIERAKITELENENLKSERDKKALEADNLEHRVEILENESASLKELIDSQEELPSEVQDAIKVRIEMLNALMAGYITANNQYEKPYDFWIKKLTDNTEEFMNSNRLAFQASHPRFIKYFEDHGLTISEINYVCLYAIGLRGKEVGIYMKKPSHVNISSGIRKKLGIDKHETNIGIYVRKLLKEL